MPRFEGDNDPLRFDPSMHAVTGVKGESRPVVVPFDIKVIYDPGFHKLEQLDLDQIEKGQRHGHVL